MNLVLKSEKYLALIRNGHHYDLISNDDGQFQFDSAKEAEDHIGWIKGSCEKYAIEYNYPMSKVNNLRFEIKQMA